MTGRRPGDTLGTAMIDRLPHSRSIRLAVLAAVLLAIVQRAPTPPGVAFVACVAVAAAAWVAWIWLPTRAFGLLLTLAVAGGLATGAGPDAEPVAVVLPALAAAAAGEQLAPRRAVAVALAGALALAAASVLADEGALAALALVVPGAGLLAGLARREYVLRAEQAEMLLAETQRSHEEQARAAALGERMRIARELHDVLAHSLSGLAIQLEVAEGLLAERHDLDGALERVRHSQQLAVSGLAEARDAVTRAAWRGDVVARAAEPLRRRVRRRERRERDLRAER
jgi:signal transduction histidine kinase